MANGMVADYKVIRELLNSVLSKIRQQKELTSDIHDLSEKLASIFGNREKKISFGGIIFELRYDNNRNRRWSITISECIEL